MPLLNSSIFQLLLAFISASILHKLTYDHAFLKWLTSRKLVCYLSPSDHDLKSLRHKNINSDHNNVSKKRQKKYPKEPDSKIFLVKTSDLDKLKLEKVPIKSTDLELLPCSLELEWIADLALMSLFSYVLTEIQFYYYPPTSNQCNFSLLWAFLVIICSIRTLCRFTWLYFRMQKLMDERSICIISAGLFLLMSMLLMLVDESKLEFGIEAAYRSFNSSASTYVEHHPLNPQAVAMSRPVSLIMVKLILAICCTITGALFTFPGLRFGQMQGGLIESNETRPFAQFIYHANYLNSLVILLLWIKPLTRDLLTDPNKATFIISDENFDTLRIYYMVFACIFRLLLLPNYLNTYLKLVETKMTTMKKLEDTMANTSIQEMIAHIYTYVNVVAIQYVLPILMCLFSAIIYKNLGGHSWLPHQSGIYYDSSINNYNLSAIIEDDLSIYQQDDSLSSIADSQAVSSNDNIYSIADYTVNSNEFKRIFSPEVFRGLLGFCNWWLHFVWFSTSSIGLIYHTKFSVYS